MASVGVRSMKLIDSDGDALDDGAGKLNVNATLVAGASIDIGDVEITGHSTIASGENDTVGTSAEVLTSTTACKHVDIMANIANTGIIYVGGSGVTSATGIALYPGDVYSLDIEDLNDVYVVATVDGENVQYTYYR